MLVLTRHDLCPNKRTEITVLSGFRSGGPSVSLHGVAAVAISLGKTPWRKSSWFLISEL